MMHQNTKLQSRLRSLMEQRGHLTEYDDTALYHAIEKQVMSDQEAKALPIRERVELCESIYASFRGWDILEPLLRDDGVTEIMVNGYDRIFVERNGHIQPHSQAFESSSRYEDIIQRIVQQSGREVNLSNPIVDVRMDDGSRVNVVLEPISANGSCMTIRRFPRDPFTLERLVALGTLTQDAADFLEDVVAKRYNLFLSGGTGSGKTTFLNALSKKIPKDERIITIEDSRELQLDEIENLISMESRNANSSGQGQVSIRDLIRASLRMRPDRIIVGEVRGEEAIDMLQAMNTGHDGSLSTGHANSVKDMIYRLETMVLQGNSGLPLLAIRQQIASAIDILVHLERMHDHQRRVVAIEEIVGMKAGEIQTRPLYEWRVESDGSGGALVKCNANDIHRKGML